MLVYPHAWSYYDEEDIIQVFGRNTQGQSVYGRFKNKAVYHLRYQSEPDRETLASIYDLLQPQSLSLNENTVTIRQPLVEPELLPSALSPNEIIKSTAAVTDLLIALTLDPYEPFEITNTNVIDNCNIEADWCLELTEADIIAQSVNGRPKRSVLVWLPTIYNYKFERIQVQTTSILGHRQTYDFNQRSSLGNEDDFSDKAIITEFLNLIIKFKPDYIISFDSDSRYWPLLLGRIKANGLEVPNITRVESYKPRIVNKKINQEHYYGLKLPGVVNIDLKLYFNLIYPHLNITDLDDIRTYILGQNLPDLETLTKSVELLDIIGNLEFVANNTGTLIKELLRWSPQHIVKRTVYIINTGRYYNIERKIPEKAVKSGDYTNVFIYDYWPYFALQLSQSDKTFDRYLGCIYVNVPSILIKALYKSGYPSTDFYDKFAKRFANISQEALGYNEDNLISQYIIKEKGITVVDFYTRYVVLGSNNVLALNSSGLHMSGSSQLTNPTYELAYYATKKLIEDDKTDIYKLYDEASEEDLIIKSDNNYYFLDKSDLKPIDQGQPDKESYITDLKFIKDSLAKIKPKEYKGLNK